LLAVFVVAAFFWLQGKLRSGWTRGHWAATAVTLAGLFALGIYYLVTLTKGAAGAKLWKVTPLNLAFALYEALGFVGLGPARNTLRDLAHAPAQLFQQLLQPRWLMGLGAFGLFYIVLAARLWKLRREVLVRWLLLALMLTSGLLYGAASVVKFPFWGRHLAPALAFVVLLVAILAAGAAGATAFWRRRGLTWLLGIAWAASSLTLRFSPDYGKDDYRGASRLALGALAAGKVVWWSADPEECAAYYGLNPERVTRPGARLVFCNRPTTLDLATWPAPDLIFQSKPDIFDSEGSVRTYLEKFQFREVGRLPAFVIWAKPGANIGPVVPSAHQKPTPIRLLRQRGFIHLEPLFHRPLQVERGADAFFADAPHSFARGRIGQQLADGFGQLDGGVLAHVNRRPRRGGAAFPDIRPHFPRSR
jgi:hypothetical protein